MSSLANDLGTRTFGYRNDTDLASVTDSAGQLLESYSYDSNGNRTSGGATYSADNQLTDSTAFGYGYDFDGHLIERRDKSALGAATRFSWGADGQLRGVTSPTGAATTYRYDALGRRIEVASPDQTRRFAYGESDNAIAEYDNQNRLVATNTFDDGLDRPLSRHVGGRAVYPIQDGLDNVVALTDSTGAVIDRYRYGAFGQPSGDHDQDLNPFTFAGREWDPASSTYFFRARNYDPATGRFISEDPLPSDLNPYSYARNNPLTNRDPSGLTDIADVTATIKEIGFQAGLGAGTSVVGELAACGTTSWGTATRGLVAGAISGGAASWFLKKLGGGTLQMIRAGGQAAFDAKANLLIANALGGELSIAISELSEDLSLPDPFAALVSMVAGGAGGPSSVGSAPLLRGAAVGAIVEAAVQVTEITQGSPQC